MGLDTVQDKIKRYETAGLPLAEWVLRGKRVVFIAQIGRVKQTMWVNTVSAA